MDYLGGPIKFLGPTGAMSAILIGLSVQYGLQGVFFASFLSGILLLLASAFKVGKIVSFIPASVVTGFTSGIAVIIAGGQIDNFFWNCFKRKQFNRKNSFLWNIGISDTLANCIFWFAGDWGYDHLAKEMAKCLSFIFGGNFAGI